MFLGHFAVAFAAKRAEPRVSLGTYVAAAQLPDLLWPFLLLAGVERVAVAPGDTAFTPLRFEHYPVSHSLLALGGWATALAGLHLAFKRRVKAAAVLWILVLSHWFLDFVTHRPDMPVLPWSPRVVGLGLWNSVGATVAVEWVVFLTGVALYVTSSRARDAVARYGLLAFIGVLALIYAANLAAPPPPSARAVAIVGAFGGLFAVWAAWVDRHREARAGVARE